MTFEEWWASLASPAMPEWNEAPMKNVAVMAWFVGQEQVNKAWNAADAARQETLRRGETPRTDSRIEISQTYGEVVEADFARQLEREVADEIRTVDALQREIERLLSIPSPRGTR